MRGGLGASDAGAGGLSAERSVGTETGGGRRGTRHWNRISVVEATECNGGAVLAEEEHEGGTVFRTKVVRHCQDDLLNYFSNSKV